MTKSEWRSSISAHFLLLWNVSFVNKFFKLLRIESQKHCFSAGTKFSYANWKNDLTRFDRAFQNSFICELLLFNLNFSNKFRLSFLFFVWNLCRLKLSESLSRSFSQPFAQKFVPPKKQYLLYTDIQLRL